LGARPNISAFEYEFFSELGIVPPNMQPVQAIPFAEQEIVIVP